VIRKFYSNKPRTGWRVNPDHVPARKGKKQQDGEKKYYSWGFDLRLRDGQRRRESGFASEDQAARAAARVRLAEKDARFDLVLWTHYPTIGALALKRAEHLTERGEIKRTERVWRIMEECLAEEGRNKVTIKDLTTADMNLFVARRRREGVKDTTINRELKTVRATLNQARDFFSKIDNFKPARVPFINADKTRRERTVKTTEATLILANLLGPRADPETEEQRISRRRAGLMFLLSLVTGARPGELAVLKVDNILPDLNALKIVGKKTRKKKSKTVRYFPLTRTVSDVLREARAIAPGEYLFSYNGTVTPTYYDHVRAACKLAGIEYGRDLDGGFIPYDLRHTATTLVVQSGTDIETISSVTGQSYETLWHYIHASQESIGRATNVLESFARACLPAKGRGLRLDKAKVAGK
jgi:integrase